MYGDSLVLIFSGWRIVSKTTMYGYVLGSEPKMKMYENLMNRNRRSMKLTR